MFASLDRCIKPDQAGVRHLLDVSLVVDDTDLPAAPVADGGLLEHVAVVIDLQRQRVLDAWVGRVALVVVADRLARVGEEDGVAVGAPGLQGADREVLFGDGVGCAGALDLLGRGAGPISVVGIDLLAQHRALEGAASFALFFQGQAGREDGVLQQQRPRGFDGRVRAHGNTRARTGAKRDPGPGRRRCGTRSWCAPAARAMPRRCCRPAASPTVERGELFRVPLLDHAEAAELALLAVEVAVVVGVAGDEAVAADVVVASPRARPRAPGTAAG